MQYQWDNTIVALATAPGTAAIGVIRISGTNAFAITEQLFSKKIVDQPSHTIHLGTLKFQQQIIDEVLVSIFKNPKSYTGEDVIEISCHGSPYIQQQIIQAIIANGARLAKPGEFTQRAFLNGKLDLTQAEAVADIIASNSNASQKAAMHTMRGGFKKVLSHLREELIQFSALMELELDFAEEDVAFADRTKFVTLVNEIHTVATNLVQSFTLGNVIKNGVSVAIIGEPNAGKSTLLNALLNEERAIVSEIAGTTRDTIEETLQINGVLFRLIDTAGIRNNSVDVIENLGIERSKQNAIDADIILFLHDAAKPYQEPDWMEQYKTKIINVVNKIDINVHNSYATLNSETKSPIIFISAKEKTDLHTLTTILYNKAIGTDLQKEDTIITNTRHAEALQKIVAATAHIKKGLQQNATTDLLTIDIRACLNYIAEITGELSNENVLDYIFSKFCIGK